MADNLETFGDRDQFIRSFKSPFHSVGMTRLSLSPLSRQIGAAVGWVWSSISLGNLWRRLALPAPIGKCHWPACSTGWWKPADGLIKHTGCC